MLKNLVNNKKCRDHIFIGIIFCVTFFYYAYFLQNSYSKSGHFHNADFLLYTMCGKDAFSGNFLLKNWFGCTNTFYLLSLIYGIFGIVIGYDYKLILIITSLLFSVITSIVAYIVLKLQKNTTELKKYLKVIFVISLIYASCYIRDYGIYAGAHMDATIISICIYILIDVQVRKRKKYLIGFIFVYSIFFLGAISDSLVIYFTLVPIFMVLVANIFLLQADKIKKKYLSIHLGIIFILSASSRYALNFLGIKIPWDGKIVTTSGIELFSRIGFTIEEIFYLFGAEIFDSEISVDLIGSIIVAAIVLILFLSLMLQSKVWINNTLDQLCLAVIVLLVLTLIFTEYSPLEEGVNYPVRILYPLFFGSLILFRNINFEKILECIRIKREYTKYILIFFSVFLMLFSFKHTFVFEFEEEQYSGKHLEIAEALRREGLYTGFANFPNSFPVIMESDYSINITSISSYPTTFFPINNKNPIGLEDAHFIIFDDDDNWGGLTEESIIDTVGFPDQVMDFDNTHIYIWEKNILPYIQGIDFPVKIFRSKILSYLGEAKKESEYITLSEGALIYGPYVHLKEGKYRITYCGENLKQAFAHLYSYSTDINKQILKYEIIEQEAERIVIEAFLEEKSFDMEFRLRNDSLEPIKLKYIQYEYLGE